MTATPLDTAHAAMAASAAAAPRLAFYDRLAEAELFVLLTEEAVGAAPIAPQVFPTEEGDLVAAFDLPERLAAFCGGPAPYAALSGRGLAQALAGGGLGLALNLGAASEIVLPPDAIAWLAAQLATAPKEVTALPERIAAPEGVPTELLASLEAKLAAATGLADAAVLVSAAYGAGSPGLLLAFVAARPGAEAALAQAVSEAVAFCGAEGLVLDVAFVAGDSAAAARMQRVGLTIDVPAPPAAPEVRPTAPGMDPETPPRLK